MSHQLIETRRASDKRKMIRCTICEQEWTAGPRIHCPGLRVVPWRKDHGNLRTATQAKKEHYQIPEDAQPVAALRIDKDPWYISLYDVSQCEQKSPTEAQKLAHTRREQTMHERYGCKLCTKRYGKKDAEDHINGICYTCRPFVRSWNSLLGWARELLADPPSILELVTKPPYRAMGVVPPGLYNLIGYKSYDLATGELIAEHVLLNDDDYADPAPLYTVAGLLHLAELGKAEKPLFVFTAECDQEIFITHARKILHLESTRAWYLLTTGLHPYFHRRIPLPQKGWQELPRDQEQSRYYRELCRLLGVAVDPDASVVEMLRLVVMDLASREEIEL